MVVVTPRGSPTTCCRWRRSTRSGDVSTFSVWGPWVSIAAPGEEIISVDPKGTGLTNANVTDAGRARHPGHQLRLARTSPGIAALVRERFPNLKARQVMERLKATALHPGSPTGTRQQGPATA